MSLETFHFQLGDFDCLAINENDREAPADTLFSTVAAEERARVLAEFGLLESGMIPNAINVLYLDTGNHRVLVDTGLGQGALYKGLDEEGIARTSIDRIVITHGHGDHIGGLIGPADEIMFPNAHYFVSLLEWRYWLNHPDPENRHVKNWQRLRAVLDQSRITFIEKSEEFLPGFTAVFLPGHTPGMMGLRIESKGQKLLHVADVAHHPLQCVYPDWSVSMDADLEQSRETRKLAWRRAANEDLLVMSYHIRGFGLGHVHANNDSWKWEPFVS